jgi:hypothetical protein
MLIEFEYRLVLPKTALVYYCPNGCEMVARSDRLRYGIENYSIHCRAAPVTEPDASHPWSHHIVAIELWLTPIFDESRGKLHDYTL